MATKTSLLGLTKPAYTDAADIAVMNTNFDLIDKAVGNRTRVHNLLVNSWFVNPVNHRGQTTYSNGYTIDRWSLLYNNVSTLSVTSDGLKFTSGSGDCWLLQRFERLLKVGAPYTFAVQYADGTKDVISLNVADESAYIQGAHCIYSINKDHFAIVGRDIPNGIVIQWVALYEGTYDADTLPTYVVPDKRIEMFRCGVPLNPPNLLVNSWFVNPVNWRGSTEVSTDSDSYFIDRWVGYQGTFSLRNNGVQIQANRQYGALLQQLVQKLEDGVYTFAGKVDGSIVWRVVQISGNTVTTLDNNNAAYSNGAGYIYVQTQGDNVYNFHFRANAGYTIVVEWAALYEGSYTADTLPDYVAPDKRLEIIRCGVPMNPPNLLYNSWFVNPVNYQGRTGTYEGVKGYTNEVIVSWNTWSTSCSYKFTSGGITITNKTTSGLGPTQILPNLEWMKGKTFTLAAGYGSGSVVCGTVTIPSETITSDKYLSAVSPVDTAPGARIVIYASSSKAQFQILAAAGQSATVQWAALYEGAYDVDTLPEYVVPDKRAEMTRCGVPLNPPNLLDNSWFANPIAQAGKNGLHGVYKMPCDRWISWDKDATFGNGYMTVNSPYDQRLDPSMIDVSKMYTAAVCFADGTVTCASGTFATGFGGYASVGFNCVANDNGIPYFRLWNNQAFSVRWAALYEGAYDAETLPEYHYKGYAAELAECQRYYENSWFGGTVASATRQFMGINISATQGDCYVQFMTPKAKVATITLYKASSTSTASVWETYRSSHYYEVTVESLGRDGRNGFVIRFTKTDADPTAWEAREAVPLRGHWEASADL